jgi:hypothetical protein
MNTLLQSSLVGRRNFEIVDDGVLVQTRQFLTRQQYKVPFETISLNRVRTTVYSKPFFLLTLLFLALIIVIVVDSMFGGDNEGIRAIVFYGTFAIICFILFVLSRQRFIAYEAGNHLLAFVEDSPSKQILDEFLVEVESRCMKYMTHKYGYQRVQNASSAEELARLLWLKERGALTEKEFEQLKLKIINDENRKSSPVGFQGTDQEDG